VSIVPNVFRLVYDILNIMTSQSLLFCTAIVALAGCAKNDVGSCAAAILYPELQLVYPAPGATAIPDDAGIVVYGGFTTNDASISVPITLQTGSAAPLATFETNVPSPVPTPTASPFVNLNSQSEALYAVHPPALASNTSYHVLAQIHYLTCEGESQPFQADLGSFTTR
jgi:hypothetical protein